MANVPRLGQLTFSEESLPCAGRNQFDCHRIMDARVIAEIYLHNVTYMSSERLAAALSHPILSSNLRADLGLLHQRGEDVSLGRATSAGHCSPEWNFAARRDVRSRHNGSGRNRSRRGAPRRPRASRTHVPVAIQLAMVCVRRCVHACGQAVGRARLPADERLLASLR